MRDKLLEQGMTMRKRVLDADYVDQQFANADEFSLPMQVLATKAAWGLVWTRPGLPPKIRSMLAIAFVVARGKAEELDLHLRGALKNGVTKAEIRELLMQSAIYCGFPEALGGFRVARAFFAKRGGQAATSTARKARKPNRKG
jgi:4-carboxymuconolactone decarboxylase